MNADLAAILSELRTRFQVLYGDRLSQMVLYGSRARGDADPDSDIDVLVVLRGPVEPCDEIARTEYVVADVSLTHNVVIACVFASEEEFEHERSPLLLNIRREGVAV